MNEHRYDKVSNQLCWNCKRCSAPDEEKCSWAAEFIPVKGWKARKTIIGGGEQEPIESYDIQDCPLFQKDKPFADKKEVLETIANTLGFRPTSVAHRLEKHAKTYEKITGIKIPLWAFEAKPRGRYCKSKGKGDD